jgi:hypothetical protein
MKFERHGRHVDPEEAILFSRQVRNRFWAARSTG